RPANRRPRHRGPQADASQISRRQVAGLWPITKRLPFRSAVRRPQGRRAFLKFILSTVFDRADAADNNVGRGMGALNFRKVVSRSDEFAKAAREASHFCSVRLPPLTC